MLYKPSKFLTLVIYEDQKATKCFEIKKNHLRWLLFILPTLTILGLGLGIYSLLNVKSHVIKLEKQKPLEIKMLVKQLETTITEREDLKKNNETLITKLSAPNTDVPLVLPLILPVNSYKDLSKNGPFELNNFKLNKNSNNITCTFDLVNKTAPDKVAGYVFAVLKAGSSIQIHPAQDLSFDQSLSSFNLGERFAMTRFRPVTATFNNPPSAEKYHVQIFVFSRVGDLMFHSKHGPISKEG